MALYLQLISRKTGEAESFSHIDEEMCRYFGAPILKDEYFRYWYNIFGIQLAGGISFAELKEMYSDENEDLEVLNWLDERYTVDNWVSR